LVRVASSEIFKQFNALKQQLEELLKNPELDDKEANKIAYKIRKEFSIINQALDQPINLGLKEDAQKKSSILELIEDICCDEKYRGMMSEEVYFDMKNQPPGPNPRGSRDGHGEGFDYHGHFFDGTSEKFKEAMKRWEGVVSRAVSHAKLSGMAMGGAQELIIKEYEKRNSKVHYVQVLQQAVINEHKRVATRRPNRRYLPHGIYIESFKSNTIRIRMMVDTSGSRFDELHEAVREILAIVSAYGTYEIHFYAVDDCVRHREVFDITNPITVEKIQAASKGGNGTNFISFFEEIEKLAPMINLCITDMEAYFPPSCSQQVIWLVPERYERNMDNAGFGRALII
jgi:predicted metal-dependent peptidase